MCQVPLQDFPTHSEQSILELTKLRVFPLSCITPHRGDLFRVEFSDVVLKEIF